MVTSPPTDKDSALSSTSVSFSLKADVSPYSYKYQVDDGPWVKGQKVMLPMIAKRDLTGLSNGRHTLRIFGLDSSGHEEVKSKEFTWTVDTVAPVSTLIGTPDEISFASTALFEWTCTDETHCHYLYRGDNGDWQKTRSRKLQLSALVDGKHTFEVKAVDAAGNMESDENVKAYAWTVSAEPPSTVFLESPSKFTSKKSATFRLGSVSTKEGRGGQKLTQPIYYYSLDGSEYTETGSTFILSDLADGVHNLKAYAKDGETGLVDPTPASHTWSVDSIEPNTLLHHGWPSHREDSVRFAVAAAPGDGEPLSILEKWHWQYRFDGGRLKEGQTQTRLGPGYELVLQDLGPGSHELQVSCRLVVS